MARRPERTAAEREEERTLFDLGRRVAELRRASGLTQEQLAGAARTTVNYVQEIEAGHANLTIRSLARLAAVFDVRVRDLFRAPRSRRVTVGRPPSRGFR